MTRRHNYYLVTPTANTITPPSFINGGIELEQIPNSYPYQTMCIRAFSFLSFVVFPSNYDQEAIYYHIHYSPEYQRVNDLYNSIALSMDYNDIIQFFAANPCHLESALAVFLYRIRWPS